MTLEELLHREAIRALVTRVNINGDRARFDELAKCFTSDGNLRWTTGGGQGTADITDRLSTDTANPRIKFVRHSLTTMDIQFDEGMTTAAGRIYFFVVTNIGPDHAGVYVDRYVRQGEEWLISDRQVRIDWQAEDSLYPRQASR